VTELRDMVVGRWVEATMPLLRAIAALADPAPQRLRRLIDALIAIKRCRAADDPELFAAYLTLAAGAQSVVAAHVDDLVGLAAIVTRSGAKEGTFRAIDPVAAGRAVLLATSRFHHPAHAAEWFDPAINAAYNDVWQLLMDGLCVPKSAVWRRGTAGTPAITLGSRDSALSLTANRSVPCSRMIPRRLIHSTAPSATNLFRMSNSQALT
jgi:Tetracyclin repressor-like, C-terminal domain